MQIYKVKVVPNKNKTKIIENIREDIDLTIELKAIAKDNEANVELIRFLSDHFSVARSEIRIVSGMKNRVKMVKIGDDRSK